MGFIFLLYYTIISTFNLGIPLYIKSANMSLNTNENEILRSDVDERNQLTIYQI